MTASHNVGVERTLSRSRLRAPRLDDAPALARHLNDRDIWRNLRDRVPHPYFIDDARAFLVTVVGVAPQRIWVIEVDGEPAGAIGLHPREDVYRRSTEIGFWLGRAYHGRGIASEVVPAVVEHGFATWPAMTRIHAEVFGWNPASARVLEKSGFALEGRLRDAVTKGGEVTDLLLYGRVR